MEAEIPRAPFYRRERVPTVIQMEGVECGAACLCMILAYYEKYVSLEELRVACGIDRSGASLNGIMSAARMYELFTEGHLIGLEELYKMPLPLVAYWEFKHFVVIEGFSKDEIYINDPARGPYTISYDHLNRSFTGLVSLFTPSVNFVKSGHPYSIAWVLLQALKRAKIPFFFAFLTGLCLVIPGLAVPAFTQVFIDNILVNHIYSWEGWFFFVMGLTIFLTLILKFLQLRVLSRLYIQLSTAFSSEFFYHILRLPYFYYLRRYHGETASRMRLNEGVAKTLSSTLTGMGIDVLVAVVFGFAMFYYDPMIALFGMVIIAGDILLIKYLYSSREVAYTCFLQTNVKSLSYSIGALNSMESIKLAGAESSYFSRWAGYYTKVQNVLQTLGKIDIYSGVFPEYLKTLTLIMILSFGAWRVMHGYLTIGMLMALVILMDNFISPITRLLNFNQVIQFLKLDMIRLNDVLNNPMDPVLARTKTEEKRLIGEFPYSKLKGSIELKNITYGYSKTEDPILKNINLKITPGTYVGIVGASGSGKSTLAKIISGLVEPWEGEVLFDHTPLKQLPRSLLVHSLSMVEQEAHLFSGSVKDNIAFFNSLVTQDEIVRAAMEACIHDLIVSRRGGYELQLKTDGSNLSGGERQRIELARALAKNPSVLILDEATSALDTDLAAQLMQNIRHRGNSCIIIAHRLITTRYCDEILVLDKGVIVQRGTPEELLAVPGLYKELIDLERNREREIKPDDK